MISYFVSYMVFGKNDEMGFGNAEVPLDQPIRSLEDTEKIEQDIMSRHPDLRHLHIISWRRWEEE